LAQTLARISAVVPVESTYLVTTRDQVEMTRGAFAQLRAEQILSEPFGRNTAPCIALSLVTLRGLLGPVFDDALLIVLPADHHVSDPQEFRATLDTACIHAEQSGAIVTLGITPDYPATGFGYMELGDRPQSQLPGDGGRTVFPVRRFVEKPGSVDAQRYLESGRYVWNAGIFIMPVKRAQEEFARHCAQTWGALSALQSVIASDGDRARAAIEDAYQAIEPIPVDVAIMEKLTDLLVVPARVGWTDLGSWKSVHALANKDARHNAVLHTRSSRVALIDVEHSLVWSEDADVAVIGMQNVAVVASGNKVVVCPLDRVQEVRDAAEHMRRRAEDEDPRS
jgi:mannose-1-phosphate guanylyltransferase